MLDDFMAWQVQANALGELAFTMPAGTREEKDEAIPVVDKIVASWMKTMQKAGAAGHESATETAEGKMRVAVDDLQWLKP